jgi:hypothetical protein
LRRRCVVIVERKSVRVGQCSDSEVSRPAPDAHAAVSGDDRNRLIDHLAEELGAIENLAVAVRPTAVLVIFT